MADGIGTIGVKTLKLVGTFSVLKYWILDLFIVEFCIPKMLLANKDD